MNSTKRAGLKLFGLCVLALGLVAFSASAAQAEGTWMYKGTNLKSTALNKEVVGKLVTPGGVTLLTNYAALLVNIFCTELELINMKLEPEGKVSENSKNGKIYFRGCSITIAEKGGKIWYVCTPVNGTESGVILSEEMYALLTLHTLENGTKDDIIVFTPKEGERLAFIQIGKTCAIGQGLLVLGQLALKDSGGNVGLEEEKATHVFEEFAPLTNLSVEYEISKAFKATLDGKVEVKLLTGEVWNGLP